MRVVLDAERFWRDVAPAVMEESALLQEEEADPDLYRILKAGGFRLVLTDGILSEYRIWARRRNIEVTLLTTVLALLADEGLIVHPKLPGGRRRHRHVPARHRAFLDDAIDAGAEFLVTQGEIWLDRADVILREYGVRVVTSGYFIQHH